jgi:hypothetical protein
MIGPQEVRQAIYRQIVASYRAIRAIERRLKLKKYTRRYVNPKCASAVKQAEDRACILAEQERHQQELLKAFCKLPEVRQDKTLQMRGPAIRFAQELAAKPRNPKYLKGQAVLVP